eukprot:1153419-Pelagomonas_calceolata.AAC.8
MAKYNQYTVEMMNAFTNCCQAREAKEAPIFFWMHALCLIAPVDGYTDWLLLMGTLNVLQKAASYFHN